SGLGLHPRLARALLDATPLVGADLAAEVVALLSEEPPRECGDDLTAVLRSVRRGGDAYAGRWRTEVRRLRAASTPAPAPRPLSTDAVGGGGARADRRGSGRDKAQAPVGGDRSPSPVDASNSSVVGSNPPADDFGSSSRPARRDSGAGRWSGAGEERAVGLVVASAFPERVAKADGGAYLMASGTRARIGDGDGGGGGLRGAEWVAVAVADRPVGAGHARVRLGAVIDEGVAREAAGALWREEDEVGWRGGDVVARRVERLGAVELGVRPVRDVAPGVVREALVEGLRTEGLGLLRWSQDAERLRERLAFLHAHLGEPWPDVSDGALHARVDDWLEPELSRARRRADLGRIDAGEALRRLLPWATGDAVRLGELAPERIEVPSGSRIRVDYTRPEQPVLAVKLQEMFGARESPVLAGVPVLVHLLSPAGRPAAVTADLASFWRDGYRAVRAELRGRYPKHPWPEDPATAEPTRHTNARLRR
ncbi:ATP-dependent helicase C-terminal domain-containing protein, partial [Streptomyces ipomoeae]